MNASSNYVSIRRGQQQNSIQILYVGIDTVSHGERESGLATRGIDLAGSFAQIKIANLKAYHHTTILSCSTLAGRSSRMGRVAGGYSCCCCMLEYDHSTRVSEERHFFLSASRTKNRRGAPALLLLAAAGCHCQEEHHQSQCHHSTSSLQLAVPTAAQPARPSTDETNNTPTSNKRGKVLLMM